MKVASGLILALAAAALGRPICPEECNTQVQDPASNQAAVLEKRGWFGLHCARCEDDGDYYKPSPEVYNRMRNGKKNGKSRGHPSDSSSQTAGPSGSSSESAGSPGIARDAMNRWYSKTRNKEASQEAYRPSDPEDTREDPINTAPPSGHRVNSAVLESADRPVESIIPPASEAGDPPSAHPKPLLRTKFTGTDVVRRPVPAPRVGLPA
ncbi:hypothetical protein VFPFJ_00910 [Purpureocillium lilacinum]|uniref:Uncharacterized protein n=1 Tax=Purpureocillium lilacinum TaxID=33203 RepID=A0A179HZ38_PURLI|nr:hypothetical protein VFPFJ_00910 [Purpureocillium lilacinum]OAQ86833.1 hypothetical protein VFPBJ_00873 [Purpureocillium lilacinum]OAQ94801.1 hypothetical protein VFPFJ_00910 [Purpureocillium lilacinum]